MAVKITYRKACPVCGGKKVTSHTIQSQGKEAVMHLPCYMCSPLNPKLAYLGIALQPIAQEGVLESVGLT